MVTFTPARVWFTSTHGQNLRHVTNPLTGDARDTDATGKLVNDTHLDPEGVNTGASDPANNNGDPQPEALPHAGAYAAFLPHSLGGSGRCRLEGFDVGCGFISSLEATGLVQSGSGSPAFLPVYSRSQRRYIGFAWLNPGTDQYLFSAPPSGPPSLKNVSPEEAARRRAYVAEFGRSGFGDEGVGVTSFPDPQNPVADRLCPPTVDQILANKKIRAELNVAFSVSGHRTDHQLEHGGWIYQTRRGALQFVRAGDERAASGSIDLRNPPTFRGAIVVPDYHTHPYTESNATNSLREGFNNMRPSQQDEDIAFKVGVPDIVVFESDYRNGASVLTAWGVGPNRRGGAPDRAGAPAEGFPGNGVDNRGCR
jgi:hypothetical protein